MITLTLRQHGPLAPIAQLLLGRRIRRYLPWRWRASGGQPSPYPAKMRTQHGTILAIAAIAIHAITTVLAPFDGTT